MLQSSVFNVLDMDDAVRHMLVFLLGKKTLFIFYSHISHIAIYQYKALMYFYPQIYLPLFYAFAMLHNLQPVRVTYAFLPIPFVWFLEGKI